MRLKPRVEKVAVKDVKLRTFITQDSHRDDLAAHVYDITYGSIRKGLDNLVVLDDSIVRGTTLKQSIIRILDRLGPKKIVIASSAPQIRYPDCYGIDMAKLNDFIAFKATIELLKETKQEEIINTVYKKCKAAGAPAEGGDRQLRENGLRTFHSGTHCGKDRRTGHACRQQGKGGDRLPVDRKPPCSLSRTYRRLVLHRQLPYSRREYGGEPGIHQLYRRKGRQGLLTLAKDSLIFPAINSNSSCGIFSFGFLKSMS